MKDETLCIGAVVVALFMVGGLAFLTWWDDRDSNDKKEDEILLAKEGDEVSVDYTGRFLGSGGELGAMFDTTIPEDARNESIPKASAFTIRDTYDDLTFTIGSGQMIKGFDEGVLGMTVGSIKYITVPSEEGYGDVVPELKINISSKTSIPLREDIPADEFKVRFPNIDPASRESFMHPFWNWEVKIIEQDPDTVTILNQPGYEGVYGKFNWNVTVSDMSSSRNVITLTHDITGIDTTQPVLFPDIMFLDPVWAKKATEANQGQEPPTGIVTNVGGIITIDFNREVSGRTLVFKVIMNSIVR